MKKAQPLRLTIAISLLAFCVFLLLVFVPQANFTPQSALPTLTLAASLNDAAKTKVKWIEQNGYTYLDGGQLKNWLQNSSWQPQSAASASELAADIIIEELPYQNELYEIRLYTSEPTLAMLLKEDQWQYYQINETDYQNLMILVLTGCHAASYNKEGQAPVSVEQTLSDLFTDLMTLPDSSSNPNDYITAKQKTFNQILSYSNSTLLYCFQRFEQGGQTDLKGNLMMIACRTLCQREDIDLAAANGQQWYDAFKANAQELFDQQAPEESSKSHPVSFLLMQMLAGQIDSIEQETLLPDYQYQGEDFLLKLVYATALEQYASQDINGFLVPAVHIHATSREENKLKVFATIYTQSYRLLGKELQQESGGVLPVAITYGKAADSSWQLEQYTIAQDGSSFAASIKSFCTTPVTGKRIAGLANKIIRHYGDYEDLIKLQNANLLEHLLKYNKCGTSSVSDYGKKQERLA